MFKVNGKDFDSFVKMLWNNFLYVLVREYGIGIGFICKCLLRIKRVLFGICDEILFEQINFSGWLR